MSYKLKSSNVFLSQETGDYDLVMIGIKDFQVSERQK